VILATPGLHLADGAAGQGLGGDVLVVRAAVEALDELVARLVHAGVAVRELAPVISPLESAFLALTDQPGQ
jgi:ABC-2 type transport system ATP-binding protein